MGMPLRRHLRQVGHAQHLPRATQCAQLAPDDPERQSLDPIWSKLYKAGTEPLYKRLKRMGLQPEIAGTFFPAMWMKYGVIREVTIDHAGILPDRADELLLAVARELVRRLEQ